jgi:hypothetical protein
MLYEGGPNLIGAWEPAPLRLASPSPIPYGPCGQREEKRAENGPAKGAENNQQTRRVVTGARLRQVVADVKPRHSADEGPPKGERAAPGRGRLVFTRGSLPQHARIIPSGEGNCMTAGSYPFLPACSTPTSALLTQD